MSTPPSESSTCPHLPDAAMFAQGQLRGSRGVLFEEHLAKCTQCAAHVEDLLDLAHVAREAATQPSLLPDPKLASRILASVVARVETERRAAGRRWKFTAALLAGAAAVFIAVTVLREAPPGGRDPLAAQSTPSLASEDAGGASAGPIQSAVRWLASLQEPSGAWDPQPWGGMREYRVGISGLVILALERSGEPEAQPAVERGLEYLAAAQGSDGLFGPRFVGELYNHSIAVLALLEANPAARGPYTRAIDRALSSLKSREARGGGWGYSSQPRDEVNPSVTLWSLEALLRARNEARLEPDDPVLRRALALVAGSAPGSRYWAGREGSPAHSCGGEFGAVLALLGARTDASSDGNREGGISPEARRAADRILLRFTSAEDRDACESYFAVRALQSANGGAVERHVAAGLEQIRSRQVTRGTLAGSWDPWGRWSPAGGRLTSTALAALTLAAGDPRRQH